ncbi:MAG: glucose-1-phosphate thymidylyltransferase [Bacteroidetes bacterium]|jgi:UDP-N-acetylglucosamine diphosphorylase/glucosamine-1-phosphate N-acetyltransferase|nr:glucose-1-phosphate thymidylyltransferase [Bacteroidota bacterium]MBT6684953.1 glucose-1-phosphate thymidylyltransferase [Bacteroidota bacterium]MBT7145258.1 glucose-1-phosphate thymidylyltransferase [Bacteroidota bacterium]MBT7493029.1 glucose-1-phosphate thymidylyltransferase [Bacteroidota bacterium]
MNYLLFDDQSWEQLLPLTFTRPVAEIRIGILTIREKWNLYLNTQCSFLTKDYLKTKYAAKVAENNILINGSILPETKLVEKISELEKNQALIKDNIIVAVNVGEFSNFNLENNFENFSKINYEYEISKINFTYEIFKKNGEAIQNDFELLTKNRKSQKLSKTNNILAAENIFLENGAKVEFATLNASSGPIYIGKDAKIMEGSIVRGPFALCEKSTLKMAAKIYGPTTIGPASKVGGEVNNSVFFGNANKAHDGFLGNSVIGEWCNLGADTNNSNLKNNYAEVRLWNYPEERFAGTGLTFCGLIMGDHSKCGINTMFNTGTVVGVYANIFGSGFPRNFIPSFAWGGPQGLKTYKKTAAFYVAKIVMNRRGKTFDQIEKDILSTVFEKTEKYRRFED